LITADEVKKAARNKGFPAGVMEKDYALTWMLYGVYNSKLKDVLAFKGGTALSKVYFPKFWRLSEDLDFTLATEIHHEEIEPMLRNCLNLLNEKTGMNFNISSFHSNPDHAIVSIQFTGSLGKNVIRMDISLKELLVTELLKIEITDGYSDSIGFTILVYSLDEILLEKLRSIIQRGKSRDYFDVWMLLTRNKFDRDMIKDLFKEKCKFKNIKPNYEMFFEEEKLNEARDFWEKGLGRLMKEVPMFDTIITDLKKELEFLK
jgi:predicted nucleotidyltransferase component of viral defense system